MDETHQLTEDPLGDFFWNLKESRWMVLPGGRYSECPWIISARAASEKGVGQDSLPSGRLQLKARRILTEQELRLRSQTLPATGSQTVWVEIEKGDLVINKTELACALWDTYGWPVHNGKWFKKLCQVLGL